MEFCLLNDTQKEQYREDRLKIFAQNDMTFVPPMSSRTGTTQNTFQNKVNPSGIQDYLAQMLSQQIMGVFLEEKLVGFVSYMKDRVTDVFDVLPNIYISTLVLQSETRGMGITKKLYNHLFSELYPTHSIYTRTWSTNIAHIKILQGFGFEELKRIPDDRGLGIDTVYYCKKHTS